MRSRLILVAGMLFLSGACALVFQVGWFREFRLVFGSSTAASAAVLAIFMGGLGLGNAWLGPRADRHPRPLAWYACLELSVAVTAALSPWLIELVGMAYVALGGQSALGLWGATVVRLALAALVLGVPTLMMGGTLPAAARAVTSDADQPRRAAAILYGVNTLGAVAGAALSTFFALEALGTRATIWLACGVNATVALAAFALARRAAAVAADGGRTGSASEPAPARPAPAALVYATAAIVGFAFFLMELVWYRMLGPLLGGSTYTFGLILAVALLGIGLGGNVYAWFYRAGRPSLRGLALTCGLEALVVGFPLALGDRVAFWTAQLQAANQAGFYGELLGWMAIAGLVVLPAALVAGVQFPLLVGLLGRGAEGVGRQIGAAVAWNTLGAIAGSLAGGFGLLPLLSAPGAWRTVVVLLALLSAALVLVAWRQGLWKARSITGQALWAPAAVALLLLALPGPTAVWRHSGIGAGRARVPGNDANALRRWIHAERGKVCWETDGVESSVAIVARGGLAFIVNGKSDGSALGDAGTQIMLGLLPALLHPQPRSAFVVGLGTGETAGWLAQIPTVEQVDVAELEPAVSEVARRCRLVNHDVLNHPKVRCVYDDAREVLLTSSRQYDVIISEPSNPFRSGIAGLFTREFYQAVARRLQPGGVFGQWLQAYEVDESTVRTVWTTLQSVYPHVEVWQSGRSDMLLVAAMEPLGYSASGLRQRIQAEPYRSALVCAWRTADLEGLVAHYLGGPALIADYLRQEPMAPNTDDRNRVEYTCARSLGAPTGFTLAALDRLSTTLHAHEPPLGPGAVNLAAVAAHRQALYATPDSGQPESQTPATPTQLALLARAFAQQGDERALPLLEALRAFQPTEAELLRAILLWRQHKPEAADVLAAALERLRRDPWPLGEVVQSALDAAAQLASSDPAHARRLLAAVEEPFGVACADSVRRPVACLIASMCQLDVAVALIAAMEPNVPWVESFLRLRKRVYTAAGHPMAPRATNDLAEFLRNAKGGG